MKVVHIFYEIKYSGAEVMYYDAIDAFKDLGIEIIIVAIAEDIGIFAEKFNNKACTVYHKRYPVWYNYLKKIQYYISFIQFLKEKKIDLVHNHSSKTYWDMSLCARLAGIPSVHTFHNVFTPHWYSYMYHFGLRVMSKYLFKCKFQSVSDSVYINELKLYKNPTTKIFNWLDRNRFYPAEIDEKKNVRNELGIAENAFVLISVGECSAIKRHSDIIKALPNIKKAIPTIYYIHLGTGELLQQEKELARELGVDGNIQFYEYELEVRKLLIASDVYIMTSKFEGISLTTIEAMACKIPTILYNVPGLWDFNKYKTTSFSIPEKPYCIEEKVLSIYNSKFDTNLLIEQAYLNIEENYSLNRNIKKIYELYLLPKN